MGASGQRLGLRLFLEGIEIPVIAASVQIGINSPATASIQIVPGDKVLEFKPRTMVHLFFWDYTEDFKLSTPRTPESVADELDVTVDEARRIIAEEPDQITASEELRGYKLLYSGEVIGVTMAKSPVGRQAVLQCSDFSTYWDTTYQFFVSYGPNGNFMGTSAAVWAGGASMFDDLGAGHQTVMNDYLKSTPQTPGLQNVKGLMGGIISLLEAMGGVPKHTHGVNDFFTIAELKNHILQQIVCEQNDDTSQRLFSNKAFGEWLSNSMSSMGQLTTFRDMMKMLFQKVYYEVVPNPAAMYVPSIPSKQVTKKIAVTELVPDIKKRLQEIGADARRLSELITSVAAPENAVKYSGGPVKKPAFDTSLAHPNSVVVQEEIDDSLLLKTNNDALLNSSKKAQQYKKELQRFISSGKLAATSRSNIDKVIGWLELVVPRDLDSGKKIIDGNKRSWRNVADEVDKIVGADYTIKGRKSFINRKEQTKSELDRLQAQIFRPDCFFVAPPKCNVLFPDQYTQFQFSRNFLQEVTRLRLHIGWEFGLNEGLLETEYYFAPATKDIQAIAKTQENSGIRALLPWEIYSGILPKFETMHEVNYVAQKGERKRNGKTGVIKGDARNYGQRVANFNYMKYRFAARSCEVSAKFNPFMVCGFPAAIIDRPFIVDPSNPSDKEKLTQALSRVNKGREQKIGIDDTSDYIRDIAREFGAPTQYVGMVAGLSHTVDQGGGTTSFTLTHARSHRITEDDFLNIFSTELTKEIETEIVSTTLDVQELMAKGDWKSLKILIDATDQQMGKRLEALLEKNKQANEEPEVDDLELGERPTSSPDIGQVEGLSQFGDLLRLPPPERDVTVVPSSANTKEAVTLEGEVRKARLTHTSKIVLEPVHPGVLQSGKKKGPKGGKVIQVQVHSNAGAMLTAKDINQSMKVYKTTYTPKSARNKYVSNQAVNSHFVVPSQIAGTVFENQGPIDTSIPQTATYDAGSPFPAGSVFDDESKTYPGRQWTVVTRAPPEEFDRHVQKANVVQKNQFVWKRITIYEEKPLAKGKRLTKLIPVEEALRPSWFSPLYSNWFIGDEIYKPFFGCGSVVDQALFQASSKDQRVNATFGTGRSQQQDMLDKLSAADGDRMKITNILEEAKATNLSDVPDVESSLDALAYIYGEVRRLGLDVHKFVHDYTYRPIATMENIFGSYNLTYKVSDDGKKLVHVKGTAGFHSSAVDATAASEGKLLGLLDNPDLQFGRLKSKGKKAPISLKLDPRPGRREKVEEYLVEINAGSGSLGIGVQG